MRSDQQWEYTTSGCKHSAPLLSTDCKYCTESMRIVGPYKESIREDKDRGPTKDLFRYLGWVTAMSGVAQYLDNTITKEQLVPILVEHLGNLDTLAVLEKINGTPYA